MEVLVVDDHKLFLDGLCLTLRKLADDINVSVASTFEAAEGMLQRAGEFDLILLDLNIDGGDGVALMLRVQEMELLTPIVAISATDDVYHIESALEAGALGFIPKSSGADEMILGLQQVMDGEIFIPEEVQREILERNKQRNELADQLTKKQKIVLSLLCEGLSNREIAGQLYLTEHTVKSHLLTLFQKLGVKNRTECVLVSQQHRLV
jgi:DNA-binding NarL/FixJ family response regulator